MSATELPNHPVYAFAPVADPGTDLWQIRIVIDGIDIAIGTSLVVLEIDRAMVVADRLNGPLGWTRAQAGPPSPPNACARAEALRIGRQSRRPMSERGAASGRRAVRPPGRAALTPIAPLRAIRP